MQKSDNIPLPIIPRPKLRRETRASFVNSPRCATNYECTSPDLLRMNSFLELDTLLDTIQPVSVLGQKQSVNPPSMTKFKLNGTTSIVDSLVKSTDDMINQNIIPNIVNKDTDQTIE